MKKTLNRKQFLALGVTSVAAVTVACSPADDEGDGLGSGGAGSGGGSSGGAGSGGAGTGGAGSGGAGTGGAGTGGAGSGGAATGGSNTGGSASGGAAATGGGTGEACTTVMTVIAMNHNHEFEMAVSAADVAAGVEKVYDIQGTAQHPHTLTITAADFADIAADGSKDIESSEDQGQALHSHMVTVTCTA